MISGPNTKAVLGLGRASTLYYLNQIQERYQKLHDKYSTYPFLLYQVDFQEINPYLPNQFDILIPKIDHYIDEILQLGISKLLVPNITLHEALDRINLPLNLCHPIDLTIDYLKKTSTAQIYMFGTSYTMNSVYLKEKFNLHKIEILQPSIDDQQFIDNFRKDVYYDVQTERQISKFHSLLRRYSLENVVIIACTELSLFSSKDNKNCVDMADLQIEEFLRKY